MKKTEGMFVSAECDQIMWRGKNASKAAAQSPARSLLNSRKQRKKMRSMDRLPKRALRKKPTCSSSPKARNPREMRDRKSTRLNSSHMSSSYAVFFFNDTATTEIYTLSLHDALPILWTGSRRGRSGRSRPAHPLQRRGIRER